MAQNVVEKITQRHAIGVRDDQRVRAGDYVRIRPQHVMTHDNTSAVMGKFQSLGAERVASPSQLVFTLDHKVQDRSEANLTKERQIAEFAKKHGIVHYPAGAGIGHQLMMEEGFVTPGSFVVASDSHSNVYGSLAAVGTPVVRTDAAALWATGETWWQIPKTVKVELKGSLDHGATGKDVIIVLCGTFNKDEVLNCALEFTGEGTGSLAVEDRMAIANMSTEWGALAAVFPFDDKTRRYFLERAEALAERQEASARLSRKNVESWDASAFAADGDAIYARTVELDLSTVSPYVSAPDGVKEMHSVGDLEAENITIQKAYLLSCVNARLVDIKNAADVVGDDRFAPHVDFYLAAASASIQEAAEELGYWDTLVRAGAHVLPAGCGPCIGLGEGTAEENEVAISATNRNFKGRMGDRSARVYLASPSVVAASAVAGKIVGPKATRPLEISAMIHEEGGGDTHEAEPMEIVSGFPESVKGRLLYLPQDNINTDGIYAGKWTYRDDLSPEQMADVAFENYDPNFQTIARRGDLIAAGANFGTGSSREQAATSLKFRGIRAVVAASFSQTYKRNAVNNGFLCVECPALIEDLKNAHRSPAHPTLNLDGDAEIDIPSSMIRFNEREYSIGPLSPVLQEIIVAGGLEAWVTKRLDNSR